MVYLKLNVIENQQSRVGPKLIAAGQLWYHRQLDHAGVGLTLIVHRAHHE
jgi:hypothetical protein